MLPSPGCFVQQFYRVGVSDKCCYVAPVQTVLPWWSIMGRLGCSCSPVCVHWWRGLAEMGREQLSPKLSKSLMERGCIPCHPLTKISFCIHVGCVGVFFFSFFLSFFFFFFSSKAYVATSTILATNDCFVLLIALPCWNTQCKMPKHSSVFVCKTKCLSQRNASASLSSPLGLAFCKVLQSWGFALGAWFKVTAKRKRLCTWL